MLYKSKKGLSEVINYVLVIVIIIGVVALIFTGIMPSIKKAESFNRFETSQMYAHEILNKTNLVLESPINSVASVSLDLTRLVLEIDSNSQKIEISHIMVGNYYDDGLYIKEGNIYTLRESQKLIVGIDFDDVIFSGDLLLEEATLNLYIKKIGNNKVNFSRNLDSGDVVSLDTSQRERPD